MILSFTRKRSVRGFFRGDRGQALPIIAVILTALLGMCALAVDVGRAMFASRELQAATDSAAIAGARSITTASSPSGVVAVVQQYSSATGGYNARTQLPSVVVTTTLKCLTTLQQQGQACTGAVPYNAVQVKQTAAIPMYMAGMFGYKTMTIASTATASARGGSPRPTNVALIVDSTLSMNIYDSNCVPAQSQMGCALTGVQQLLMRLYPCGVSAASCADKSGNIAHPFDQVALFTFPAVSVSTAAIDTTCTTPMPAPGSQNYYYNQSPYGNFNVLPGTAFSGLATSVPYNFPTPGMTYKGLSGASSGPTYQITGFLSDYRVSDTATTLNTSSALVKAAGAVAGCGGLAPPNYEADYETYYAGVLYAAQSALVAQQAANPGSENVIIILSDGDSNALQSGGTIEPNTGYPNMSATAPSGNYMTATSSGTYPSWVGECTQAVTAAQAAATAGTQVYSVGYGSEPTGCSTDTSPKMSPCNTMAGMASAPQYFYSDYLQSNSNSTCLSSQPVTSLSGIFTAIANDLTEARLIPNYTK